MITYIPGLTVVRCDKCREYKAVLSGAPGKREIQRELKRQGWKVTENGHYCGRCVDGSLRDGKAAL